jgi:acetate kinase
MRAGARIDAEPHAARDRTSGTRPARVAATLAASVRVLVVNAGSTSLKLGVVDTADLSATPLTGGDVAAAARSAGALDAVGHRVVHGGQRFEGPVLIDDQVRAAIASLTSLAPLHQPPALAGIDAARAALPGLPQVASFDTAFHRTLPPGARLYAIPAEWRRRLSIRRYGFHGLSVSHAAPRAAEMLGRDTAKARVVVCHLGGGASVTAVDCGRSVETTMGYSPLEGLVMATRSGTVDPAAVLALVRAGLDPDDVERMLDRESGLLGLAGTSDMREVLARAAAGEEAAGDALAVYAHRVRAAIAAGAAAMGGLDAVAFTGGVGERAPEVRRRCLEGLAFLGVDLDEGANGAATDGRDARIDRGGIGVLVVAAREDLVIAREAAAIATAAG